MEIVVFGQADSLKGLDSAIGTLASYCHTSKTTSRLCL